jgi:hypothetical protein
VKTLRTALDAGVDSILAACEGGSTGQLACHGTGPTGTLTEGAGYEYPVWTPSHPVQVVPGIVPTSTPGKPAPMDGGWYLDGAVNPVPSCASRLESYELEAGGGGLSVEWTPIPPRPFPDAGSPTLFVKPHAVFSPVASRAPSRMSAEGDAAGAYKMPDTSAICGAGATNVAGVGGLAVHGYSKPAESTQSEGVRVDAQTVFITSINGLGGVP